MEINPPFAFLRSRQDIAIIGGGPAGLRAAEVAAEACARVTLYDAKPSVGRKFLVAGKSGLNLTNGEDWSSFLTRYHGTALPTESWNRILQFLLGPLVKSWGSRGMGYSSLWWTNGAS